MVMYQIYNSEEGDSGLTVVLSDGTVHQLSGENPTFAEVAQILLTTPADKVDEDHIIQLMQPVLLAGKSMNRLSERVTFDGHNLFFDGDMVDGAIANHIVRIMKEGGNADSYKALVSFMEKLYTNPSEESRKNLYPFILNHGITIDPDGDFYAYKGVQADGTSVYSGFGIINGVSMNGHLPNHPGNILEMPRSQVVNDPTQYCGIGLHAGSFEYAQGWSQGMLLLVKINPRDVVSVPLDAGCAKIRTCRYKVVSQIADKNFSTTAQVEVVTDSQEDADSDDLHATMAKLSKLVKAGEEIAATFTYERSNGTTLKVELELLTDVRADGSLITGKREDGEYRSYMPDFITDFSIVEEKVADTAPAKEDVVDTLAKKIKQGNVVVVSFDYTTAKGEARSVKSFKAEEVVSETPSWKMFCGTRADGAIRNYRSDRMENVVIDYYINY